MGNKSVPTTVGGGDRNDRSSIREKSQGKNNQPGAVTRDPAGNIARWSRILRPYRPAG